jgi:hypothetical protein
MRMENGNTKPVIANHFTSLFHFPFPVSRSRFFIHVVPEEKIDSLLVRRGESVPVPEYVTLL